MIPPWKRERPHLLLLWGTHICIWGWCYWHYRHFWWHLGQTRLPVPLWCCCCCSFLGYRKSFGCESSQQTLSGLCSSSRHGWVVWWILGLVGGASGILWSQLRRVFTSNGVSWSRQHLEMVCGTVQARVHFHDLRWWFQHFKQLHNSKPYGVSHPVT